MEFNFNLTESSIINMSEAYANRMIRKTPEFKDILIKYALSHKNNIGMFKYLIPNATSNDILKVLDIKN